MVALAAIEENIADEALELVEVDYEPLEPLLDPLQSMSDRARDAAEVQLQTVSPNVRWPNRKRQVAQPHTYGVPSQGLA